MSGLPDIGHQSAKTACAASAPKDLSLISGPSSGLACPARRVMTAAGELVRDNVHYMF
jgi:hypothetical protein